MIKLVSRKTIGGSAVRTTFYYDVDQELWPSLCNRCPMLDLIWEETVKSLPVVRFFLRVVSSHIESYQGRLG